MFCHNAHWETSGIVLVVSNPIVQGRVNVPPSQLKDKHGAPLLQDVHRRLTLIDTGVCGYLQADVWLPVTLSIHSESYAVWHTSWVLATIKVQCAALPQRSSCNSCLGQPHSLSNATVCSSSTTAGALHTAARNIPCSCMFTIPLARTIQIPTRGGSVVLVGMHAESVAALQRSSKIQTWRACRLK